jgi:hypothetical protein
MSDVTDMILDGLLAREEDVGAQITFAGATMPCSGGDELMAKLLQQGGFKSTPDVTVVVRMAAFPDGLTLPLQQQSLTYISAPGALPRPLRVKTVDSLMGVAMVLKCMDPHPA